MMKILSLAKDRFFNPKYPFRDRLYFMFGTAGVMSAGGAFAAAISSGLPQVAATASLFSFFIMLILMIVSLFTRDVSINRVVCSAFLNFFMFPVLFWVTGGINCGMIFYFMLGMSVAALILVGKMRVIILALTLIMDMSCLYVGFEHPELAYSLSYKERQMDTLFSFLIVSLFIIAVIIIMSIEYQKAHNEVLAFAAQLEQQAITDNLTNLYNQRYLMAMLKEQVTNYNGQNSVVSIVMFDVDNFKKINDTYGHVRGDQVLCQLALILKEQSGEHNIATRYGGEEFIIILPAHNNLDAHQFAENVRLAVLNDVELQCLIQSQLTVSGGVAQYEETMTIDGWINSADKCLYDAKRNGKNCIVG